MRPLCHREQYVIRGHGKVTLWPALLRHGLRGDSWAAFPTREHWVEDGYVHVLFDTLVQKKNPESVLRRISGDAAVENRIWWGVKDGQSLGHALKASYGDREEATRTRLRIRAQDVTTPGTEIRFAGDGCSSGMDYNWEF